MRRMWGMVRMKVKHVVWCKNVKKDFVTLGVIMENGAIVPLEVI